MARYRPPGWQSTGDLVTAAVVLVIVIALLEALGIKR